MLLADVEEARISRQLAAVAARGGGGGSGGTGISLSGVCHLASTAPPGSEFWVS